MAFSDNTSFGPPPIQTPIVEQKPNEFGVPWQDRIAQGGPPAGDLNHVWAQWFSALYQRGGGDGSVSIRGVPVSGANQSTPDFKGGHLSVDMFGDAGRGRLPQSLSISAGASVVSSSVDAFLSSDVGNLLMIAGAGVGGAALFGTVTGYTDAQHVTISATATYTVGPTFGAVGPNDTAVIQSAVDALAGMQHGQGLYFPAGVYLVDDVIMVNDRDRDFYGDGFMTTLWQVDPSKPLLVVEGRRNPDIATGQPGNIRFSRMFMFQPYASDVIQCGGRWPHPILANDGDDVTVTTVLFDRVWVNGGKYGIHLFSAADCEVKHCIFEGAQQYSTWGQVTTRTVIHSNQAYSVGGFSLWQQYVNTVTGEVYRNSEVKVSQNVIDTCDVGMCAADYTDVLNISGNVLTNAGRSIGRGDDDGIQIGPEVTDVCIVGNMVRSITPGSGGLDGLNYALSVSTGAAGVTIGMNDLDTATASGDTVSIGTVSDYMLAANRGYRPIDLPSHDISLGGKFQAKVPDSATVLEALNTSAGNAQQFLVEFDGSGNVIATTPRASTRLILNGLQILDATGGNAVVLPSYITASRPLKANGSKAVISDKIDLGSSSDVAGTGLSGGDVLGWDGAKVVPASASPVSTQSVVTGSRAFGTVYQNTTGKPMFVTVSGNGNAALAVYTDSSNPPTTQVASSGVTGGGLPAVSFYVLPGNYYKVVSANALTFWTEWH